MNLNYRLPTKLTKFKINDPFLILLVCKYESEIPWQTIVIDERTLQGYVKDVMLKNLYESAQYPFNSEMKKHYFVTENNVNLDLAINNNYDLTFEEVYLLERKSIEFGDDKALQLLLKFLNQRKSVQFKTWIDKMSSSYKKNPAFIYLLLKPLFEKNGKGHRLALAEPCNKTIKWLNTIISKSKFDPNINIAKSYYNKKRIGSGFKFINGWVFFDDPLKLSSACQGSGWCIASIKMAKHYIDGNNIFYILFDNSKPEVALRINKNKQILECQGTYNMYPNNWLSDIQLFTDYMELKLQDGNNLFSDPIDIENKDYLWWQKRIELFPLSILIMPLKVRNNIEIADHPYNIISLLGLFSLPEILEKLSIELDKAVLIKLIELNPIYYNEVLSVLKLKNDSEINEVCLNGWVRKVEDDDLILEEISILPQFVKEANSFKDALINHFPESVDKMLKRRASSLKERSNKFKLENVITEVENEPYEIAIKRAVNLILSNDSSDFSNAIFGETLKKHASFNQIREQAWIEACLNNPTFIFASPANLKEETQSLFNAECNSEEDLEVWIEKINFKPWLLTQQTGVPKYLRYNIKILENYLKSWAEILTKEPWKLWKEVGGGQWSPKKRVYISYAALKNKNIMDALIRSIQNDSKNINQIWEKASDRMKAIPAFQLAIIIASSKNKNWLHFLTEIEKVNKSKKITITANSYEYYIDHAIKTQNIFYTIEQYNSSDSLKLFKMTEIRNGVFY
jgi:hypothetical protein